MMDVQDYWNAYYATSPTHEAPSQFAAFVLSEFPSRRRVVEIGCGDGRDALFFARYGRQVVGVDASKAAVARCESAAARLALGGASFLALDFADAALVDAFRETLGADLSDVLVYARFFLHAAPEEVERKFLRFVAETAGAGAVAAVEFRTPRDAPLDKATTPHYRRFLDPDAFVARAVSLGLCVAYRHEGRGLAKFQRDDAFVARILLEAA